MFEEAERGQTVSKKDFDDQSLALNTALLDAQRRLRAASRSVVVVVSGVEGAGKGGVVNRLNQWLDARGVQTQAFWKPSEEELERPAYWRFWRALPPRGTIGVLFGSWYTQPIVDHVFDRSSEADFSAAVARVERFERLLADEGTLLVKLWFHIRKETQQARLERDVAEGHKSLSTSLVKRYAKHYDRFKQVSAEALRRTDAPHAPWHVIEAEDPRHRDLEAGRVVLDALMTGLTEVRPRPPALAAMPEGPRLADVDLERALGTKESKARLAAAQRRLDALAWRAHKQGRHLIGVFEGWDAAGKGGAIRRVTAAIDARLFRVIPIAAPTDEEQAHHYLWRFWRHIPRAGHVTLYDRSWYGRVLVERVEGFAAEPVWRRAYEEIVDFETQLVEHGAILLKFWLHISADEQLRRFEARAVTPHKAHKITEEDWRNRERWGAYEEAVHEMLARTSTAIAPWTLVAANHKPTARVQVVEAFCDRLEAALRR